MAIFDVFRHKSPYFGLQTARKMFVTIFNVFYSSWAIVRAIEHYFLTTLGFGSFWHKNTKKCTQIFIKSSHVLTCSKIVRIPCSLARSKAESPYFSIKISFLSTTFIFEQTCHGFVHWPLKARNLFLQKVTYQGVVRKRFSMASTIAQEL